VAKRHNKKEKKRSGPHKKQKTKPFFWPLVRFQQIPNRQGVRAVDDQRIINRAGVMVMVDPVLRGKHLFF
jgi:hypothetical protein